MSNSVEKLDAKLSSVAKGFTARLQGLTGIFKTLAQEHSELTALLERAAASESEDIERDLYPEIRRKLLSHEKGELLAVYPMLASHPEMQAIVSEHGRQAGQLERTIGQLDRLTVRDADWPPTFERLVGLVRAHVDQEESEFFPAGERAIGHDQAEALQRRYEAQKQLVLDGLE